MRSAFLARLRSNCLSALVAPGERVEIEDIVSAAAAMSVTVPGHGRGAGEFKVALAPDLPPDRRAVSLRLPLAP